MIGLDAAYRGVEAMPRPEQTERATPKRREEARKRGQVAKSIDLAGAGVFLAGVFALAGNATSQNGGKTFWNKKHDKKDLFPVTKGYNGSCSPAYLCTDGTHEYGNYGGPTGWGTPNGIGAF